jgi:predicted  nucleic acid-binding Zn-ribbon protein
MRITRLLGLLAAVLAAGVLVAPGATAQPPFRLPGYVTDQAGALSATQRGEVQAAVDKLYNDRKIRLWVVYVDNFSGQGAVSWARNTMSISDFGNFDALLAVATQDRAYAFEVPSSVGGITSQQVDDLRRNKIEPALRNNDWRGAALAAAGGLDATTSGKGSGLAWSSLLIALGIVAMGVLALVLWSSRRRSRRRSAEVAAARRVDPTDPNALASVSLDALDDLSKSMVVDVDNAVRSSSNELDLAVEEFGEKQTEPFSRAVNNAKTTLAQAFNVRQQLDDAIPETPAQRRDLLTRVVTAAARADRELEAQTEAFEKLRDLVVNAPSRLDSLTRQLVDVTARVAPSQQKLAELHNEFDDAALTSVTGNVTAAQERLSFADQNITRARELAAHPVAGRQTELVDSVRAVESAVGQARALLDAVDSAATDVRHAAATLPSSVSDIQSGISQAGGLLAQGNLAHAADLGAARDAAVKAVAAAQTSGATDPLGAFAQLTRADADLDRLLDEIAQESEAGQRLGRAFDQAVLTAQSRVRAVSDYIDTRRGSIGPQARTRLSEAVRQLEAAHAKRSTNPAEAIAHANEASMLAAQAQSMANADVQAAQRAYTGRYGGGGSHMGAIIGGIVIGDILGGAMGGGFGGGWSPTGFGGSGGDSGGGNFGGGGRF